MDNIVAALPLAIVRPDEGARLSASFGCRARRTASRPAGTCAFRFLERDDRRRWAFLNEIFDRPSKGETLACLALHYASYITALSRHDKVLLYEIFRTRRLDNNGLLLLAHGRINAVMLDQSCISFPCLERSVDFLPRREWTVRSVLAESVPLGSIDRVLFLIIYRWLWKWFFSFDQWVYCGEIRPFDEERYRQNNNDTVYW